MTVIDWRLQKFDVSDC